MYNNYNCTAHACMPSLWLLCACVAAFSSAHTSVCVDPQEAAEVHALQVP